MVFVLGLLHICTSTWYQQGIKFSFLADFDNDGCHAKMMHPVNETYVYG